MGLFTYFITVCTVACVRWPNLPFQNNGEITDFVSFYTLPSTVMHHPQHKTLKAAYSFYNVSTTTPRFDLMQDCLVAAKNVSTLKLSRALIIQ